MLFRSRLLECAGRVMIRKQEVIDWVDRIAELEERIANTEQEATVVCDGCGMAGCIVDGRLMRASWPGPSQKVPGNLRDLKLQLENAKIAYSVAGGSVKESEVAAEKLAVWTPETGKAVDDARAALAQANLRQHAKEQKLKGVKLHWQITGMLQAKELLGPLGLRRRMLLEKLEAFNEELAEFSKAAGWSTVALNSQLVPTYAGRSRMVCSTSEQYRIDATLQAVFCDIEDAPIMVLDGAEVLDRAGRNGLMKLLQSCKRAAVVGMTSILKKDGTIDVPDLTKLKLGTTYWVESGRVTVYGDAPVPA